MSSMCIPLPKNEPNNISINNICVIYMLTTTFPLWFSMIIYGLNYVK